MLRSVRVRSRASKDVRTKLLDFLLKECLDDNECRFLSNGTLKSLLAEKHLLGSRQIRESPRIDDIPIEYDRLFRDTALSSEKGIPSLASLIALTPSIGTMHRHEAVNVRVSRRANGAGRVDIEVIAEELHHAIEVRAVHVGIHTEDIDDSAVREISAWWGY